MGGREIIVLNTTNGSGIVKTIDSFKAKISKCLQFLSEKGKYFKAKLSESFKWLTCLFKSKNGQNTSVQLAAAYIEKGKLDEAFELIKELPYGDVVRESFAVKIAHAYFNKGDLTNALKSFDLIHLYDPAQQEFILKIAEFSYEEGNIDVPFNVISRLGRLFVSK